MHLLFTNCHININKKMTESHQWKPSFIDALASFCKGFTIHSSYILVLCLLGCVPSRGFSMALNYSVELHEIAYLKIKSGQIQYHLVWPNNWKCWRAHWKLTFTLILHYFFRIFEQISWILGWGAVPDPFSQA